MEGRSGWHHVRVTPPDDPRPESDDGPIMLPEAYLQPGPDGSTQPLQSPPYGGAYGGSPGAPPAYGQAYPSPYGPYGYGAPLQNHPSAQTAMVLGLVGLIGSFFCLLPIFLSPFAWAMGARARREIDASGGTLGGRDSATVGYVTGIIGTVLLVLGIVAVAGFIALVAI